MEVTEAGRLRWSSPKVELGLDEIRYHADPKTRRGAADKIRTEINNIGAGLRALRHERGLTQGQLGGLCGLDARQIRRLESEDRAPRIATLEAIAQGLEMSVLELGAALQQVAKTGTRVGR